MCFLQAAASPLVRLSDLFDLGKAALRREATTAAKPLDSVVQV
jgi:hypothetical protein